MRKKQSEKTIHIGLTEAKKLGKSLYLYLMEDVSTYSLARMVNKFVYHKNLNSMHWVTVENNVVKINRFKGTTKKKEKHKKSMPHQTITQSWGL